MQVHMCYMLDYYAISCQLRYHSITALNRRMLRRYRLSKFRTDLCLSADNLVGLYSDFGRVNIYRRRSKLTRQFKRLIGPCNSNIEVVFT